jgi:hypothetical protein
MDPWGATEPMSWWTLINRERAIEKVELSYEENVRRIEAAKQGLEGR